MDGATPMQAFRKVILPLAMPGVFTAGDPRVHRRVERLPVRDRADLDRRRTDGAGGAGVLPGASQFTDPSGAIAAARWS